MKKVFLVFSHSGTILSKVIRLYTRKKYSHISISLDEDLKRMYSFGRLRPYNPFLGGFVHEEIHNGTYKRFNKTKSEIYSLDVTDKQYDSISKIIDDFYKNKERHKFNVRGLMALVFHIKYKHKNNFYCAEFIKYLMENSDVKMELPELIKPMDFMNNRSLSLIYKGKLAEYR